MSSGAKISNHTCSASRCAPLNARLHSAAERVGCSLNGSGHWACRQLAEHWWRTCGHLAALGVLIVARIVGMFRRVTWLAFVVNIQSFGTRVNKGRPCSISSSSDRHSLVTAALASVLRHCVLGLHLWAVQSQHASPSALSISAPHASSRAFDSRRLCAARSQAHAV